MPLLGDDFSHFAILKGWNQSAQTSEEFRKGIFLNYWVVGFGGSGAFFLWRDVR